jgi:hypothetical protein
MLDNAPWNRVVPAQIGIIIRPNVRNSMRSKPETFAAHARECELRAEAASDRQLRDLFRDLASQWRGLAATAASLAADAEAREDFYNCNPHIRTAVSNHRDT